MLLEDGFLLARPNSI